MSCISFLFLHAATVPDPQKINHAIFAFIVGLTARVYMYFRKSIFDNSIGRLDSESPVDMAKPRFVSKQHIKFLNIESFSCFDNETVTWSFSLVSLQFIIPCSWRIEPKITCIFLYLSLSANFAVAHYVISLRSFCTVFSLVRNPRKLNDTFLSWL